jgi:hypothetical protein
MSGLSVYEKKQFLAILLLCPGHRTMIFAVNRKVGPT